MRSDIAQKIAVKNEKRPFSKLKRFNSVSLRGAQRRGNLKAEGMAFRGEARECETKKEALSQKMDFLRRSASSFFQGSVSFRLTIVRFGMTNRSV